MRSRRFVLFSIPLVILVCSCTADDSSVSFSPAPEPADEGAGNSGVGGNSANGGVNAGTSTGGSSSEGGGVGSGSGGTSTGSGGVGAGGSAATQAGNGGSAAGAVGTSEITLQSGTRPIASWNEGVGKPHCEEVTFPRAFTARAQDVHVQVTAKHPGSTSVHDAMTVWVERIQQTGFSVCMEEDAGADNTQSGVAIDWMAYATPQATPNGLRVGELKMGNGGSPQCALLGFGAPLNGGVQVQITPNYRSASKAPNSAVAAWLEELNNNGFRVCASELLQYDKNISSLSLDWIAYPANLSGSGFMTGEASFGSFAGTTKCEKVATNCQNCQNVQLTVNHRGRSEPLLYLHDPLFVWAEDFTSDGELTICIKEIAGSDAMHDSHANVSWIVRQTND